MHHVSAAKPEGMREEIDSLQQRKMKNLFEGLQQELGGKEGAKNLLAGLGRKLGRAGVNEREFALFLEKEVAAELSLILAQMKKEWVDALDNADDMGKVSRARDGVVRKAGIIDSMSKQARKILAVAYCLRDAGRGGGFSNMSDSEAEDAFGKAVKEADEKIEKIARSEVSEVYRKIAFGA
ncbi:MAG: hypothetical protein Sv326_1080 [Candidatus Fermentimicrarchaeum limneticum]|uniref:Uncharacterized protein n=1 Tax=Fermentimicrarchaeum limneticum TaxID=2795018 RepID=A0A7D6BHD4_FERL1|nr:MAG: hypothetical protein Sv326_1080 [Candidatus Fermentimicrarchaeum limneticum]